MKILYKSLFNGWVEVNEDQQKKLIEHMNKGITAMSGKEKQDYINNKFIIK